MRFTTLLAECFDDLQVNEAYPKVKTCLYFFARRARVGVISFCQEWVKLKYAPESVKTTELPTNQRPVLKSSS